MAYHTLSWRHFNPVMNKKAALYMFCKNYIQQIVCTMFGQFTQYILYWVTMCKACIMSLSISNILSILWRKTVICSLRSDQLYKQYCEFFKNTCEVQKALLCASCFSVYLSCSWRFPCPSITQHYTGCFIYFPRNEVSFQRWS